MPTEKSQAGRGGRVEPGALLLCRVEPVDVAPVARLLRERMLLGGAGEGWSVLVPEGRPWLEGAEPVDRVVAGWASALAVGASWPVLALWWDPDRAGYTLASGFRRPVGYVWLANGTPAGMDEAMRTFAGRLGLDPVLDVQELDRLTEPDAAADAVARLSGLLAVLGRAGVSLPPELTPGAPAARLHEAAGPLPGVREVDGRPGAEELPAVGQGGPAEQGEVRPAAAERATPPAARHLARLSWATTPAPAVAQLAAGLPMALWGLRHRSAGWITAGALLLAHGTLALVAYSVTHPRD
ncbi:hypothetical protein ACFYOV_04535 [Streptomyces sp. NPDC005931]|uniref:hypothetical protein n=1 Tax=Streptomyces sp. NPDC005931 TaxID=3364737 RepID=UPI00368914D7